MLETVPATGVPVHIVPDAAFIFRYLIAVHSVTCYLVLTQALSLRLRPTEDSPAINKFMLWACILVPLVQFPVSIFRVVSSLAPEFCLKNPIEAYTNFFWSPMCTIYLVWLVQVFMATKCKTTLCRYDRSNIICKPRLIVWMFFVLIGVVYSHLFYAYLGVVDNHNMDLQLRLTAFIALIFSQLEVSYHHGAKKFSLVSYSLFFFVGTWLYFLRFI